MTRQNTKINGDLVYIVEGWTLYDGRGRMITLPSDNRSRTRFRIEGLWYFPDGSRKRTTREVRIRLRYSSMRVADTKGDGIVLGQPSYSFILFLERSGIADRFMFH
jgi:hypothetical protein